MKTYYIQKIKINKFFKNKLPSPTSLYKYGYVTKFWLMSYKEKSFLELTGSQIKEDKFRWEAEHFVLSSFHLPAAWGEEGMARAKKAILNNVICSNMEWPRDCRTDWSQSDREGEILYDIPYMWNLKRNDKNELIYKTKADSQTREGAYGCWEME